MITLNFILIFDCTCLNILHLNATRYDCLFLPSSIIDVLHLGLPKSSNARRNLIQVGLHY